jgi:hypothetical protein
MTRLKEIEATFWCDGCGKPFTVEIDPVRQTEGWAVYDYAVDGIRESIGVHVSLQGTDDDKGLCEACTRVVDLFVTEDRNATDDEINDALDREPS